MGIRGKIEVLGLAALAAVVFGAMAASAAQANAPRWTVGQRHSPKAPRKPSPPAAQGR